jgi:hypothetical protein
MVHVFTRSLEALQSSGALNDSAALKLIDLFQQRNAGVVSACQVLELDGNESEFQDSLRVIAAEHMSSNSPRTKERLLKRATNEEAGMSSSASTPGSTNGKSRATITTANGTGSGSTDRERLVQSFAQRVQDVDELERTGTGVAGNSDEDADEEDEEEEDEDGVGDLGDAALEALLNKPDTDDWNADDVQALYSKVLAMQTELAGLKQMQREERARAGLAEESQEEDEEDEDEDDEFEEEEEEEEKE